MELNPPYSIEAEQALLGSLLINPDIGEQVIMAISTDEFYDRTHKEIFEAMSSVIKKNIRVDLITLVNELKSTKKLDELGGEVYLTELADTTPTSSHFQEYLKIVKDKSILRKLISAGQEIAGLGQEEAKEVSEVLSLAQDKLDKIIRQQFVGDSALSGQDLVSYYEEQIQRNDMNNPVPSGFPSFDKKAGLYKGEIIFIGALPSMGKSALGMTMAINAVENEKKVLFISTEMYERRLIDRMYSRFAGVDNTVFKRGTAYPEIMQKGNDIIKEFGDKFKIARPKIPSLENIINLVYREIAKNSIDLVIIDHCHAMDNDIKKGETEAMVFARIMRKFSNMTNELGIALLLFGQFNKEGENSKRPQLKHIMGSASFRHYSAIACVLHRDNPSSNNATLHIEKNRNGDIGEIELKFDGAITTFYEVEKDNVQKYLNS